MRVRVCILEKHCPLFKAPFQVGKHGRRLEMFCDVIYWATLLPLPLVDDSYNTKIHFCVPCLVGTWQFHSKFGNATVPILSCS